MGVDWYEYHYLLVEYKERNDDLNEYFELSREGRYCYYESDEEDGWEKEVERRMEECKKKVNVVYENGEWKITNKSKIDWYTREIGEKNMDKVSKIVRKHRGEWRL